MERNRESEGRGGRLQMGDVSGELGVQVFPVAEARQDVLPPFGAVPDTGSQAVGMQREAVDVGSRAHQFGGRALGDQVEGGVCGDQVTGSVHPGAGYGRCPRRMWSSAVRTGAGAGSSSELSG